jgi:diguanylate cyclase (GGDEF)-like protein
MDVDRFKEINDNHGHLAGDFVLEEIARAIRSTVRNVDVAARYGGDEFAVLLPESDAKGAAILAERLRARVAQQRFRFDGGDLEVRMSFGVAMHRKGESPTELVKAADEALYAAKREGGDRVHIRE